MPETDSMSSSVMGASSARPGEVVVHELGQQRERGHGVDEVVQEELLALLGVGLGLADDGVGHRQHLDGVGIAASLADLLLLVLVVRAGDVDVGIAGEDQLRPARRELTAPARRARLQQHRAGPAGTGARSAGPRTSNHSPS